MSTQFDSITFGDSLPRGMSLKERQRRKQENGFPVLVWLYSELFRRNLVVYPSSPRIWELSRLRFVHCATNLRFREPGSCNSLLTGIRITRTFPAITFPTRSCTRERTIMPRLGNGTRTCRN